MLLFGILLIELAAGGAVTFVVYRLLLALFEALGWAGDRDFVAVCGVFVGLIAAVWPVARIDRWGKRISGASALDTFDVSGLP